MKIEVSAKTIEKAIEDGLKQLNTTIENVDVKVISEGGMFKKAKIEMTLSEDNNEIAIEKAEEVSTPVPENLETEIIVENKPEEQHKEASEVLLESIKVAESTENVLTDEEKQQRKQEALKQLTKIKEQLKKYISYGWVTAWSDKKQSLKELTESIKRFRRLIKDTPTEKTYFKEWSY